MRKHHPPPDGSADQYFAGEDATRPLQTALRVTTGLAILLIFMAVADLREGDSGRAWIRLALLTLIVVVSGLTLRQQTNNRQRYELQRQLDEQARAAAGKFAEPSMVPTAV